MKREGIDSSRIEIREGKGAAGVWSLYVDGRLCIENEAWILCQEVRRYLTSGVWDETEACEVACGISKALEGGEGDAPTPAPSPGDCFDPQQTLHEILGGLAEDHKPTRDELRAIADGFAALAEWIHPDQLAGWCPQVFRVEGVSLRDVYMTDVYRVPATLERT